MNATGDSAELRATLHKRHEVLAALATTPQTKPRLVETVGPSRSTIDRAISALEDADCIERLDGDYHLTPVGRISSIEYERYNATIAGVSEGRDVLNALSDDVHIDPVFFDGVTVQPADPRMPESALRPSILQLESADRLVAFAPVILSFYTDLLTDHVNNRGLQTEIILHEGTLDSLFRHYRDPFGAMNHTDHFDIYATDYDLPYALWIMERDEGPVAGITVHENGGVRGVLTNDSPSAVEWASEEYTQYRDRARHVTVESRQLLEN